MHAKIFGPIPYLIIIPVIITFLMWILMNRTSLGRYMLAYGNNVQSSELMGISSTKIVVYAHIISGLLAAIGGMLVVCRLQLGIFKGISYIPLAVLRFPVTTKCLFFVTFTFLLLKVTSQLSSHSCPTLMRLPEVSCGNI